MRKCTTSYVLLYSLFFFFFYIFQEQDLDNFKQKSYFLLTPLLTNMPIYFFQRGFAFASELKLFFHEVINRCLGVYNLKLREKKKDKTHSHSN